MSALDITGREIKPGMQLAYAVRVGNTSELRIYTVLSVDSGLVKARRADGSGTLTSTLCKPATNAAITKEAP